MSGCVTDEFGFLPPDIKGFRPGTSIKAKADLLRLCRGREHCDRVSGSVYLLNVGCRGVYGLEHGLAGGHQSESRLAVFFFFFEHCCLVIETLMAGYRSARWSILGLCRTYYGM